MPVLKNGMVEIYTGAGKGKTTAALGLAWRMLGAGGRVYICQFLKPRDLSTGEANWAKKMQKKQPLVFDSLPEKWDMAQARSDREQFRRMQAAIAKKLTQIKAIAGAGKYDLIILDEIVYCLYNKLARQQDVLEIIRQRARHVEIVLTGRGADKKLMEQADLVTQMREIKHPYQKGQKARRGIEY